MTKNNNFKILAIHPGSLSIFAKKETLLKLRNISHRFSESTILRFPDFNIREGESFLISGNSGSGKTTLLHIAAGILKPTEGTVHYNRLNLFSLHPSETDKFRGKNIGIIFQRAHLVKNLTVIENVLAAMFFAGKKADKRKASKILEELNLKNELNKLPYMLSQGQAQRASVARAVINDPSFIYADEPSSSLDDENAMAVVNLLTSFSERLNASLIVSSHDQRIRSSFSNVVNLNKTNS